MHIAARSGTKCSLRVHRRPRDLRPTRAFRRRRHSTKPFYQESAANELEGPVMTENSEATAKQVRRRGPGRPFPPGVSGKSGGRPKGSKTFAIKALIAEALSDPEIWNEAINRYRETLKAKRQSSMASSSRPRVWSAPRFDCSPWGRKMPREAPWAS